MKTYKHISKEIYYGAYFSKTLDRVFVHAFSPTKKYDVETIPLDAVKCSHNEFLEVKNKYYVSKRFEWFFKNEKYNTCSIEKTIEIDEIIFKHLVWNCGKVYKAYFKDNKRVYLECGKWTSKNNCLGIMKIIDEKFGNVK